MKTSLTIKSTDLVALSLLSNVQRGMFLSQLINIIDGGEVSNTGDLIVDRLVKPYEKVKAVKTTPSKEYSQEAKDFLKWIQNHMKYSSYVVKSKRDQKTADSFMGLWDKLIKEYSKAEIIGAIQYATSDPFWKKNFLSPLKLDKHNDKAEMKHIDLFISQKKASVIQKTEEKPTGRKLNYELDERPLV